MTARKIWNGDLNNLECANCRYPVTDTDTTCPSCHATFTLGADTVNHPAHYNKGGIECIDVIEAATEGLSGISAVCTANAIKYLYRWSDKGGAEDLKKARWYINRLLSKLGDGEPTNNGGQK